jgi:hypothetical protein
LVGSFINFKGGDISIWSIGGKITGRRENEIPGRRRPIVLQICSDFNGTEIGTPP